MADPTPIPDDQPGADGGQEEPREDHRWPRLGLFASVLLIAGVVVALPFAVASMQTELLGRQQETLYEFPGGTPITEATVAQITSNESFYNLAVTDVDEANGTVDVALTAQRNCAGGCASLRIVVASLGSNAPLRQGLPPSVTVDLGPTVTTFAESVSLPVEGWPSLYPFDAYTLRLGVSAEVAGEHGRAVPQTAASLAGAAVGTVQNATSDLLMEVPRPLDPTAVAHPTDANRYLGVMELSFRRPLYLRVLGVMLPLLVALSTALSVATRQVGDLLVGIGSIVIGIWGVRSVMVPSGFPVVTTVDLSLSMIILLMLLALAIRSARQLHRRSGLPRLPVPVPPGRPRAIRGRTRRR